MDNRDRLVGMLSAMTDEEFRQVAAEARGPASVRQSLSAKASQLAAITEQCRDGNGYTAGIADAAAARGPAWQPPPEPPQPQPPGWAPNRAQAHSGSGTDPVPQQPPTRIH